MLWVTFTSCLSSHHKEKVEGFSFRDEHIWIDFPNVVKYIKTIPAFNLQFNVFIESRRDIEWVGVV